jgi:hypothetical protein
MEKFGPICNAFHEFLSSFMQMLTELMKNLLYVNTFS